MNDVEKANQLYKEIAQTLIRNIDGEWNLIQASFGIKEINSFTLTFKVHKSGQSEPESLKINPLDAKKIMDTFTSLRNLLHKPDTAKWDSAVLSLKKDGSFNMDFKYPD